MSRPDIINRATYKRIKKYNREELNAWLYKFGLEIYNDGCRDAACAEILALRDEFGFGTQRIARFMVKRDSTVDSINKKLITVEEILDGLREEGLRIKTDFEPDYETLKKIATLFNVSTDCLLDNSTEYYTDPETARLAKEAAADPDMRLLLDAKRDLPPEDMKVIIDMAKRLLNRNDT